MESLVCRCPLCGMVVTPDRIESGPYWVKVYVKEFGGKVAGTGKGRGKAKGYIKYDEVDESESAKVKEVVKTKVKQLKLNVVDKVKRVGS